MGFARRHVREKATIDSPKTSRSRSRLVRDSAERNPTTATGLPVEDQVRKEWDSRKAGLPAF
jgi:hypothetical protein